ncbi:hypothetical protein DFH06DRAFT_1174434 [Mycena polygramma]|nr:hypothetical protein DFH06DRAFT_1234822 [Mycena polygramma]KAJ7673096.1 hypothetical protein DFH06DRAFT_1174434 [Mycena polygramma]
MNQVLVLFVTMILLLTPCCSPPLLLPAVPARPFPSSSPSHIPAILISDFFKIVAESGSLHKSRIPPYPQIHHKVR